MGYTSGNALNYKDLLATLATFVSANGWTILEQSQTTLMIKGTGISGLDEIYCGFSAFENTTSGYYNWDIVGSWTYRAGRAYNAHPRSTSGQYIHLWNSTIPYWIVATPRRIILVAKISTVYQFLHVGLIDPIGTSSQYPYPLLIAGCSSIWNQNYTVTGNNNQAFWADSNNKTGQLLTPGGYWQNVMQSTIRAASIHMEYRGVILKNLDGSYLLDQIYMVDNNQSSNYGLVDGLYRVSGYQNSSENIITVAGTNYMVFQDVYRLTNSDFCALRMN